MSYWQLTEGRRYQISALVSEEFLQRKMPKLNIAPSTFHQELRRNNSLYGSYDPQQTQKRLLKQRLTSKSRPVSENVQNAIEFMFEVDWNHGQISVTC
jgi:IS30 family transposase